MRLISKYGWIRTLHVATLRAKAFMRAPWAGGVVLLACVVAAMLLANLPATKIYYRHLLETELSVMVHSPTGVIDWIFPRGMNVEKLINDGLMVVFFFAVGLEIKREVVRGQLSSFRQAILPVVAAAGGMIAPAVVFTLFNHGTPAASGWGIPTATDIAFAVGILSMLERRIPVSLKIFLMALAVADDLGAILVIAFFYGGEVRLGCLVLALAIMLGVYAMKRLGEKRMAFYLVPAVAVWSLFYYSGVHSTISGVAMALLIPMEPRYGREYFVRKMRRLKGCFDGIETAGADFPDEAQRACLRRVGGLSTEAVGMSDRLEHALAPYVTFLVMPIFALANAGVVIESAAYFDIFHRNLKIDEGQTVHFELGRSLVAQCGELITRALYNKETSAGTKIVIVDAGMTDLIRPALYGAKHKIENLTSATGSEKYTIGGPICESSDIFGRDVELPVTSRGDLLTLRSAGAYGMAMASRYNLQDLPGAVYSDKL